MAVSNRFTIEELQECADALEWDDGLPLKSVRRPEPGYVYFIGGDCDCVKIGFAKDPVKRLKQLRIGSPTPLFLLAMTAGEPHHEKEYHRKFRHDWSHGEWFRKTPKLMGLIEGFVRRENYERNKRGLPNMPAIQR